MGCGLRFRGTSRSRKELSQEIWCSYVFGKQTIRELCSSHHLCKRTIRNHLKSFAPPLKHHQIRPVHLVADALHFGSRKEGTDWCAVVGRDADRSENLWWTFAENETTDVYIKCRDDLELLGYNILSVTGDGFGGIRVGFKEMPFQMCHVHMERIVVKGTTNNPKTEAGAVLLALVRTLYQPTDSITFNRRLHHFFERYGEVLREKTWNMDSGRWDWTHEPLRRAAYALQRFQPYLFTFEKDPKIPRTTNTLDGHFRHVRDTVDVHCGLSRKQKEEVLNSIFLASSTAPHLIKLKKLCKKAAF